MRQPPRRPAAAGRIAGVFCLALLALALSAGPAAAYPCGGSAGPVRTLSARSDEVKECTPVSKRPLRRKADPISFAFFVGMLIAVLLVPVAALSKREDAPRE